MRRRLDSDRAGYVFVAPAALYLALFSLLPILVAGYMSMHRWHLLKPDRPFVGLANYTQLLEDPFFRNAVVNSCVYALASVPLGVLTSLAVALLVARRLPGVGWFRTVFYIPAICSEVALSMVWLWILMPERGLINYVLGRLNAVLAAVGSGWTFPTATNFINEPGWAMASLVLMSLWIGLGPRMIIFVAGLHNIPEVLYEAAALDGCAGWRRFWNITAPQLAPTTLFVTVTTTIAAFQLFTPIYIMTQGGPLRTTDMVLYHIFKEAWQRLELGMASAQSYVLFALIVVVAAGQLIIMRRGLVTEEMK
jgi:multiple sugar transport system permease protein